MTYILRATVPEDEASLAEMLYLAIYTPPGSPRADPVVVQQAELRRYFEGWGRPGDVGFLLADAGNRQVIGAAWLRLFPAQAPGYGYVDSAIPELTIAVREQARGAGLGMRLLAQLIGAAGRQFAAISLSVTSLNPARRLYERFGFETVGRQGETETMLLRLDGAPESRQAAAYTSPVQDVMTGQAARDGQDFGGWLLGDISAWAARTGKALDPVYHRLRATQQVEVKWGVHPAGQQRPGGWTDPTQKMSLSVLVRGDFILRFQDPSTPDIWLEYTLRQEGDFVIWRETIPHTWEARSDCTVLTVRWADHIGGV